MDAMGVFVSDLRHNDPDAIVNELPEPTSDET